MQYPFGATSMLLVSRNYNSFCSRYFEKITRNISKGKGVIKTVLLCRMSRTIMYFYLTVIEQN